MKRDYLNLIGNRNCTLSDYLPKQFKSKIVHLDPEFETYTYGDTTRIKRAALLKLNKNDLIVFYLGGKKQIDENSFEEGCFIFGFFEINKIVDWDKITNKEKIVFEKIFRNNAHIISSKSRNNLVMIKGNSNSKILKRCIQISERNTISNNPPYITKSEFQTKLGLRKNIVRAVPMYIYEASQIKSLKKLLFQNC